MKKFNIIKTLTIILGFTFVISLMSFVLPQDQKKGAPWKIPEKYQKMKNPLELEKVNMRTGKMLYSKYCKSCHGNFGKGNGPKAKKLKTFPGDFSTKEFKNRKSGSVYYQSFIGRDEMKNFEKKIPDEEDQWTLVSYILNKF